MAYPIQQLRDLFSIAKDVKDDDLQKAFYEADMLDMSPQLQRVFEEIPAEYLEDTSTLTGAKKNIVLLRLRALPADKRAAKHGERAKDTKL